MTKARGKIIGALKEVTELERVHYWSDGAASHFKSRFNMNSLLYHKQDFGVTAEWSFFGSNHGKGPVDGIGGTVKRSVYLAVLQNKEVVNGYEEFIRVAKKNNSTISVPFLLALKKKSSRTRRC